MDSFNPFQPGDYFNSLYNKVSPDRNSPMIVVLEEIDMLITKMHDNSLMPHRDIPTQITNKTDWNQFFDRFDRLQFPYVYFIMTRDACVSRPLRRNFISAWQLTKPRAILMN